MTRIERLRLYWLTVAVTTGLAACGGGSSGDSTASPSPATAPSPSPSPAPSGDSALGCLPAAQYVVGYTNSLTYQATNVTISNGVPGTPVTTTTTSNSHVTGTTTIAGTTVYVNETTNPSSPGLVFKNYDRLSGNQTQHYGHDRIDSGVLAIMLRDSPAVPLDFGAARNQVNSYSYTETSTAVQTNVVGITANAGTGTFVGLESVSTPIGTFNSACRFDFTLAQTDASGVTTTATGSAWYAQNSGIILKRSITSTISSFLNLSFSFSNVLAAGTVNGSAIVAR